MAENTLDFSWTRLCEPTDDSLESKKVFNSQVQIMQRLFKPTKTPDLVKWYQRRIPNDLPLYTAFGLIEPVEYEYLNYHMNRWQEDLRCQGMEQSQVQWTDDEDEVEQPVPTAVMIPGKIVGRFLEDKLLENYDQYEGLMLRLGHPIRLVNYLRDVLDLEGCRTYRTGGVSAVDELMCQTIYPETEFEGWVWMNKMVAGQGKTPLNMSLKQAEGALKELNKFQLYEAISQIYEYSLEPTAVQKEGDNTEPHSFPRRTPRIQTALLYLIDNNWLDEHYLTKVLQMDLDERDQEELRLKRGAVCAFLSDIAEASSDTLWLQKMVKAFGAYFKPILQEIGVPTLNTRSVCVKGKDGQPQLMNMLKVSFAKPETADKIKVCTSMAQLDNNSSRTR